MSELKITTLISKDDIQKRIVELAAQINRDYEGKSLTVVGILKGSIVFFADLIRHINVPVYVDFMEVSSYGDETVSSGVVKIIKDLSHPIQGLHVLLVEDIVESGLTLTYLSSTLRLRGPESVKICSLLEKPDSIQNKIKVDYSGFKIGPEFVVGYGLDYKGLYRNLNYVGVVKQ